MTLSAAALSNSAINDFAPPGSSVLVRFFSGDFTGVDLADAVGQRGSFRARFGATALLSPPLAGVATGLRPAPYIYVSVNSKVPIAQS